MSLKHPSRFLKYVDNETAVIRNHRYGQGPLVKSDHPEMHIPLDMIRFYARTTPDAELFATRAKEATAEHPERPYIYKTYREGYQRILRIASGMRKVLGIQPGDRIGIFSPTREEYHVLLFCCGVLRCIAVPVYESVGKDAVSYIIHHSNPKAIFADAKKLAPLKEALERLSDGTFAAADAANQQLRHAEQDAGAGGDAAAAAESEYADLEADDAGEEQHDPVVVSLDGRAEVEGVDAGFVRYALAEIEGAGTAEEPAEGSFARAEDINMIMYTSGTTGRPKGVMLSHGAALGSGIAIYHKRPEDALDMHFKILSFMPLAHVFGIAMDYLVLRSGGCIGFYSGNPRELVSDMVQLRPTIIGGVPRIYQRIYDTINAQIRKQSYAKQRLFDMAYARRLFWMRKRMTTAYTDALFFGAIRKNLGGELRICVSGGAPLPPHVMEWFRIVVCDHFLEGYGQTELFAAGVSTDDDLAAFNDPARDPVCDAGLYLPYITSEVKLINVESMNYVVTSDPPRGELCIRATTLMSGYYKDPRKTAETIDKDGFLHTGDIAVILPTGKIKIIDRIRSMFKLSQGEYVSAEYIEQVLGYSPVISQAFVHGDSDKNFPIAIIVPNKAVLRDWAKENGLDSIADDIKALCKNAAVLEYVKKEVLRVSIEQHFKGYEVVKNIYLHPDPFTQENDMLTPSFKLKRHILKAFFKDQIAELYGTK